MALKWCHFLIVRQAINEVFMDVNFWMSLRKGHATAGNQTNKNVKKKKNQKQSTKKPNQCIVASLKINKETEQFTVKI